MAPLDRVKCYPSTLTHEENVQDFHVPIRINLDEGSEGHSNIV